MMRSGALVKAAYAVVVAVIVSRGLQWRTITVATEDFGKFRLTTYELVRPFTFGDGRNETLCSRISNVCLEDRSLIVYPAASSARFILVSGAKPNLVHFFDTTTGSELPCRNCDAPLWQLYRQSNSIVWSLSRQTAPGIETSRRAALGSLKGSPFIIVLDLEINGINTTRIAVPPDALAEHPRHLTFSPTSDVLAWHACPPATSWQNTGRCTLWSYRISDRRSDHRVTPCPDSYLGIGWEGDTPRAQLTERGICLDANGQPKLPISATQ